MLDGIGSPRSTKKKTIGRRVETIGRYPFTAMANRYLQAMQGVLANSTHKELTRRYKRMNTDLLALKEAGKINSTNPHKLTDLDVLAYISQLRSRGVADSGIDHNLDGLAGLLKFIGNGAVEQARVRFKQHFPRGQGRRLEAIRDEDRMAIIRAANAVSLDDWQRMVAYGITVLAICTGLRPKEVKNCRVVDVNLDRGTFTRKRSRV